MRAFFCSDFFCTPETVLALHFGLTGRVQSSQPASAAISIPPNLVLPHTCLFSINVLSVTVSKRRAEFCSSGIQVGSPSRVEFRRYSIQPGRLHCLHDPQPMLCVVPQRRLWVMQAVLTSRLNAAAAEFNPRLGTRLSAAAAVFDPAFRH